MNITGTLSILVWVCAALILGIVVGSTLWLSLAGLIGASIYVVGYNLQKLRRNREEEAMCRNRYNLLLRPVGKAKSRR